MPGTWASGFQERSSSDFLGNDLGPQSVRARHQQRGEAGMEMGFGGESQVSGGRLGLMLAAGGSNPAWQIGKP